MRTVLLSVVIAVTLCISSCGDPPGVGSSSSSSGSSSSSSSGSSGTARVSIWTDDPNGVSDVQIDGVSVGGLSMYFPAAAPSCGQSGTLTMTLPSGNHFISANSSGMTWSSSIVYLSDGFCTLYQLMYYGSDGSSSSSSGSSSSSSSGSSSSSSSGSSSSSSSGSSSSSSSGGTTSSSSSSGGTSSSCNCPNLQAKTWDCSNDQYSSYRFNRTFGTNCQETIVTYGGGADNGTMTMTYTCNSTTLTDQPDYQAYTYYPSTLGSTSYFISGGRLTFDWWRDICN